MLLSGIVRAKGGGEPQSEVEAYPLVLGTQTIDFGSPWTNFGRYDREVRVYHATTYNQTVIAADEAEAMKLEEQDERNFPTIFKEVGTLKVNGSFRTGVYKAQT